MGDAEVTARIVDLAAAMSRRGPYRAPVGAEVDDLADLADALAAADVVRACRTGERLGLAAEKIDGELVLSSDPTAERAWLVLVFRPGVAPDAVVEVPHPNADLDTERIAFAVHERRPATLVLQAGAHRIAGAPRTATDRVDCPADVVVREDSPFARIAAVLAGRGLPQVQLHGFADRGDVDVVLSPGAAAHGALVDAVRAGLAAAGERISTGDDPRWADLLGRRNVQGRAAARAGAAFVHLELSRSLRRDPERRDAVADALAAALDAASGRMS
ncbi:hypothetical protein Acsp06_46850 [Actinomycetospora sp. NBRC 106375]|uniref:hypothetical protein n=1 Tax=Actinomycetospora sp. NBRC 106375 TaxID=3032207 RepID=UPI0024A132E8|nr:hypothetical protein [Actinomycetospora sp. NBRC 106375]GLZ48500.1 hypothetical protein Acsp06_46850 [Actinomycetospora sp. NBRC 106375]